jgi:hypothetical protein
VTASFNTHVVTSNDNTKYTDKQNQQHEIRSPARCRARDGAN